MLGKIRLADRQGLLSQPRMSRVQVHALSVLALNDSIIEADETWERMKRDLQLDLPPLQDDDWSKEEGPIEWVMPEDFSPADAMDVLAQLGGSGMMGLADLTEGAPE